MNIINFIKSYFCSKQTKFDKQKIPEDVLIKICSMWNTWKANPGLYKTQDDFIKAVNKRFNLNKSRTTIVRHIKAKLNETV